MEKQLKAVKISSLIKMLELKSGTITTTDKWENELAIDLYKRLNVDIKNYKIKVIKEKYSYVDIEILNTINNHKLYVELKTRTSLSYSSFFMGINKLKQLEHSFKNTVLVWRCKETLYFTPYNKKMLNYEEQYINNGIVVSIEKIDCMSELDNLIQFIKENLNAGLSKR